MAEEKKEEVVVEEEEEVVTLKEVVEEQLKEEEDARALLQGRDGNNCTYTEGSVSRQPVYTCITCQKPEDAHGSAICYGCSLQCHDGHQLVELYTKRLVCCDCGNTAFPDKCKLYPEKIPRNLRNQYNQNYKGLYCTCHRPYPDDQDPISDHMLQCIVCEDWFHSRHLSANPLPDNIAEVICALCVHKLPFLQLYAAEGEEHLEEVVQDDAAPCILAQLKLKHGDQLGEESALFWMDNRWRSKLCRCRLCKAMYERADCCFLTDMDDTIEAYERRGAEAAGTESSDDQLVKALVDQVDRTVAVEMIHGYNSLKEKLTGYLKRFADEGKVVREDDVRAFFSDLQETTNGAKKARMMPPSSCR